jgi:LysM repeat protein
MLLAGCYQTAGSSVIPTVAELTATTAPPIVLPTIVTETPVPAVNQPSPTDILTIVPPSTPVPVQAVASATLIPVTLATATPVPGGQPAAQPSDTPFITAISTQGFLTPTSGGVVITAPAAGTPASVNALTPTVFVLNTPTAFPTEGACVHTVQPGDHVYSIAREYKVSVNDLIAANPSLQNNPDQLQVGQTLTIPCVQPTVPPPPTNAAGTTAPPAGPTLYAIVKGDTLLSIAHKFNTTVAKLEQANGLNDLSILHIGQQLIIPPS